MTTPNNLLISFAQTQTKGDKTDLLNKINRFGEMISLFKTESGNQELYYSSLSKH